MLSVKEPSAPKNATDAQRLEAHRLPQVRALLRWLVVALAIGAVAAALLVNRSAGAASWTSLGGVAVGWLLLGVLVAVGSWLLTSTSLLVLGRAAGFRRPLRLLVPAYMAGNFCGLVTPFGSGGTPGQAFFVSRLGVDFGTAFAVAASRGLISSTIVASAAGTALVFMPGWLPTGAAGIAARTALAVVVALLIGMVVVIFSKRPSLWVHVWARRANRPLSKHLWTSLASQTDLFRCALRAVGGRPSALLLAAVCEASSWVLIIAVAPLVVRALGWQGPAWVIYLRALALFLVIPMSPTPGSAGSAEVGFFVVGKGLVPNDTMAAAVLLWRTVLYYLPLAVGGLCFAWLSARRVEEVQER